MQRVSSTQNLTFCPFDSKLMNASNSVQSSSMDLCCWQNFNFRFEIGDKAISHHKVVELELSIIWHDLPQQNGVWNTQNTINLSLKTRTFHKDSRSTLDIWRLKSDNNIKASLYKDEWDFCSRHIWEKTNCWTTPELKSSQRFFTLNTCDFILQSKDGF